MNDFFLKPVSDYKSNCYEINCDLYDLMFALNFQHSSWEVIHKLSAKTTSTLSTNFKYKQSLLNSSILCVVPSITSKSQWLSLIDGDAVRVQESFIEAQKNISPRTSVEIHYMNKTYLKHLINTALHSPLASLELGIPFEIIDILKNLTVTQRNNIYQFKLPLFKWRYENSDSISNTDVFNDVDWLTYLIRHTPHNLLELDQTSNISLTYSSEKAYPYAEQLVQFNMRATIIQQLIPNLHSGKIRDMYKRILDTSSSCGKLPTSPSWYFSNEKRRLHSSFFLLLYRIAYRAGLKHIPSIISAYAWYRLFVKDDPMSINRAGILVNVAQSGSGLLYTAACKKCEGNYVLANLEEKREFSHNYHCCSCSRKSGSTLAA